MPAGSMIPAPNMPPTMGRNGSVSDFGSTSGHALGQQNMMVGTHHHPQLNPLEIMDQNTPESIELGRIREEDFELSKSGSYNVEGGGSGEEQDPNRGKQKQCYHRHTQHQIAEMEAFFKECPHPDEKQRKELGRELGLEPLQIKFWFQNKRTQMKNQHERLENSQLRAENEKLRAENIRYKEVISNTPCPNCGGPTSLGEMSLDEHHLRIENAQLRDEIDKISTVAEKYVGEPIVADSSPPTGSLEHGVRHYGGIQLQPDVGGEMFGSGDHPINPLQGGVPIDADKPIIIELAVASMDELFRLAQLGEPMWVQRLGDCTETLCEDEYIRVFSKGNDLTPIGFKSEGSRDSAVVIMNHINLVEILMDVNQWSTMFSGIVSRATTIEVFSTGIAGNYDGALQVMCAEFQVPSPSVPTRESMFARYCKQHATGTWIVVDVSLNNLCPNTEQRCKRRPSGCLIQEMQNGYSKVIWVEHVEANDRGVEEIYKLLVNSTLGFGAKRWVATLDRQCERLASLMANSIPPREIGVIMTQDGRKSMLKLAERMLMSFYTSVGASNAHTWTTLSGGAGDVRVMARKNINDPGRPAGIVLSAATSFWMPVPPRRVFDFLRDENSRNEWDILSNGGTVEEVARIANGRDPGNCVSLLRVNSTNSSQSNMLILQESCIDATGSYVIYAPVDISSMNNVLSGGDPDFVALLPSGFAILPDGAITHHGNGHVEYGHGGTLLTVAFQILVDSVPSARLNLGSVTTVNSLIACTVDRIKTAIRYENP